MKSNACVVKRGGLGLEKILTEVEKVTAYNGLQKKEALRLRLLAEELVGMLPELVKNFEGCFWLQNDEKKYELKSGDCIILERGKHHGGYEKMSRTPSSIGFIFILIIKNLVP